MFCKKLWVLVCTMMFLAGCGGGAAGPKGAEFAGNGASSAKASSIPAAESGPTSFGGADVQSAPPSPPSDAAPPSAAQPSGRSVSSESRRSAEPRPQERPGLGTEWGEARTSRVHDVAFVRDSSRPFALAALNYNDRKGVEALAARAQRRDRSLEAGGGAISVSIRDESGEPLEAVHVGDKTFVIGQAGQRYSIVLTNQTSHRFEAVATVDGLDVVNGKDGSFDNRGYVLLPFATLEIEGFRQSSSQVASFRFASVADSYAAQVGKARNVGVIGVAFFSERGDSFIPEGELRTRETASPFPADPRFAPPPPRH